MRARLCANAPPIYARTPFFLFGWILCLAAGDIFVWVSYERSRASLSRLASTRWTPLPLLILWLHWLIPSWYWSGQLTRERTRPLGISQFGARRKFERQRRGHVSPRASLSRVDTMDARATPTLVTLVKCRLGVWSGQLTRELTRPIGTSQFDVRRKFY